MLANSRTVAEAFGKRHDHVLRDIGDLIEKSGSPNLGSLMFQCFTIFDERANREVRSYEMTRDGFTLLAMGFTGEKAAEIAPGRADRAAMPAGPLRVTFAAAPSGANPSLALRVTPPAPELLNL